MPAVRLMPRVPKLPAGSLRLFGRVDRFTVECPRCAELISATYERRMPIGHVRRAEAARKRPSAKQTIIYNPLTSRLCCPRCRRTFAVGLVLYPVHPRSQPQQPDDTRPTWEQLLELRQLGAGFYIPETIKGKDPVNLFVERECPCEGGKVVLDCPIHGWDPEAKAFRKPSDTSCEDIHDVLPVGGEEEE
jgi:hypothetical protein